MSERKLSVDEAAALLLPPSFTESDVLRDAELGDTVLALAAMVRGECEAWLVDDDEVEFRDALGSATGGVQ